LKAVNCTVFPIQAVAELATTLITGGGVTNTVTLLVFVQPAAEVAVTV
jgi:hypothetical protein